MRNILICRRTFICTLAILCLTAIGLYKGIDVSMALASVAIGLAGANAYENAGKKRITNQEVKVAIPETPRYSAPK